MLCSAFCRLFLAAVFYFQCHISCRVAGWGLLSLLGF